MTDFEDRLREQMRAEVSGVQPADRLAAIRRRTEQSTRSTWWIPMASGLAALGLVAAAVVGVATTRDGAAPGPAAGSLGAKEPSPDPAVAEPTGNRGSSQPTPSLAPVYLTSPTQVVTDGPLRVTGESNTFEATVNWRVIQGGDIVREGYAMGGSYGEWKPFHFTVDLPPGSYTVEVFEASAKNGSPRSLTRVEATVN